MSKQSPAVLLVGRSLANSPGPVEELQAQGCQVVAAASYAEAHALLNQVTFDLVLSSLVLPDGSASRLIPRLLGSDTSMFFSFPVERGNWWLPALERGAVRWGTSALRASEFAHRVRSLVGHIRRSEPSGEDATESWVQPGLKVQGGMSPFDEVQR